MPLGLFLLLVRYHRTVLSVQISKAGYGLIYAVAELVGGMQDDRQ